MAVAIGGAIGSLARHGVNVLFSHTLARAVPWATAAVNVAGSLVIGWLAGAVAAGLGRDLEDLGLRVELDVRTDQSFGRRAVDWELKGVPVRLEIGPRDLAQGQVTLVRRDDATKSAVPLREVKTEVASALGAAQAALLAEAAGMLRSRTAEVTSVEEALEAAQSGFARLPMGVVGDEGEDALNQSGVTVRCLLGPDDGLPEPDAREETLTAVVGRAY